MTDQPIACTLPADDVPGRLALVDALATLESRCCAFLTFAVERSGDAVVLDVTGAPGAATRQLADAG